MGTSPVRIGFSKESLEGGPTVVPDGLYELRLEGFEPSLSKKGTTTNLNPVLKIVNHPVHAGFQVREWANTGAPNIIEGMIHAFGFNLEPDGNMPGTFMVGPNDKQRGSYEGPMVGAIGKAMLRQVEGLDQNKKPTGKLYSRVDEWLCNLPGCDKKHQNGLAG